MTSFQAGSTTISNTENVSSNFRLHATLLLTLSQVMKYMSLDQKGYAMAEYIWIDGNNGVRSKTKVRIGVRVPAYSLNCRSLASCRDDKVPEASLSDHSPWRQCFSPCYLSLDLTAADIRIFANFSCIDSGQAMQRRQGTLGMEL